VYVEHDSSVANCGNVSDDDAQLRYSTLSRGNADSNSALCGMFGISGLQQTNTVQTMCNLLLSGFDVINIQN